MDLRPLDRFISKVERLKSGDIAVESVKKLSDAFEKQVQTTYRSSTVDKPTPLDNGNGASAIVTVTDRGLWFKEYGTGDVGSGKYLGELPSGTLSFTSWGKPQTTEGWVYFYEPNGGYAPNTQKFDKASPRYWMMNGVKFYGNVPQMGFYYAVRYLRDNGGAIIRSAIKGSE